VSLYVRLASVSTLSQCFEIVLKSSANLCASLKFTLDKFNA